FAVDKANVSQRFLLPQTTSNDSLSSWWRNSYYQREPRRAKARPLPMLVRKAGAMFGRLGPATLGPPSKLGRSGLRPNNDKIAQKSRQDLIILFAASQVTWTLQK